jgi:hypothetical protein
MNGLANWRGRLTRRSLLLTALVATFIVGAGFAVNAAEISTVGAGVGGCFNPVDYGAVANDGVSDRVPIQAAIDAATGAGGGTVCLNSGRWTVDRAPSGSYDRFAALSTHGAHLTVSGTGPGTVIELPGDQGAAQTSVISLDPGASDITIQGLAIDTSAATNTDEQTHAIEIGSGICSASNGTCSMPIADITVRDVRFLHPASTVANVRKGDCIRLLGNDAATQVKRVTIIGSSFISCARSGIAVQRNVSSLAVLGNHFGEQIGDTPFDSEATGGDWDDGLRLEGNSFANAPATFSATITTYRHATITGNTFADRGLFLYRTQDVVVSANTFDVTAIDGYGVIESENVASGDKIDNNTIRRHGAPGAGIRITPHSGGIPQHVTISNNTISVDGDSYGIDVESPSDIGIRDNDITFTGAAPNGVGVYARATAVAMNGMMITGNTVTGPLTGNTYFAAVQMHAGPFAISGVTVAMNSSRGALHSLVCSQSIAGNFPDPIVSFGNRWNIAPTCPIPTQPGQ